MATRRSTLSIAATMLLAVACGEPPADPTGIAPSLHRDRGRDRTVVVDPNGKHDATTIQAGIDLAPAGGRVRVRPGTYVEALVINKGLTLEGTGGDNNDDDDGESGHHRRERVIIAPPGAPAIAVQVATSEPVVIRDVTVHFSGANGIRGDGVVDLTVDRVTVRAVNPPLAQGRLVGVFNDANVSGGRAHLVVQESFLDGSVPPANSPTPAFPQMFGITTQGDIDAVLRRNVIRRTGGACILVNTRVDFGGEMNADIFENDLDECYSLQRAGALLVQPPAVATVPTTATGVVNIVGNTIRNTFGSCLVTTAISHIVAQGRIERNRILNVVPPCATPTATRNPGAIWVGSLNPITPGVSSVVRFNDIVGNAHAGLRIGPNITTPIDARCNYWGSASGPSGAGLSGTGDAVVVETGAATPVLTPFATRPIAGQRHGGDDDDDDDDGDGGGSCRLDYSLWSEPVNLGPNINSAFTETGPALSPDGLSLYFESARPGVLGGTNIRVAHRASLDSPWEASVELPAPVNSPSRDGHPNFSRDGHLLFVSSDRQPQGGLSDIYVSRRTDTHDDFAWGPLVPLGGGVNTAAFEAASSYMATAEAGPTNLYFTKGEIDGTDTDIWSAAITRDGETLGPAKLVAISAPSPYRDAHPTLRVDGREVIFYATRPNFVGIDLVVSTRPNLHAEWSTPVNLGAPINTAGTEIHPTLSFDGRTLLWSSDRAGSLPGRDLWMSTRTRIGSADR